MDTARVKWLLDDTLAAKVITLEAMHGHTLMQVVQVARDEIEKLDEALSRIASVEDRPESVTKLLLEYGVLVQPQDGPTLFDSLEPTIFDAATDSGPWTHTMPPYDPEAPGLVITEIKDNDNG